MFNLFPDILFLAPFSALIIRILVGFIIFQGAYGHIQALRRGALIGRKYYGIALIELATGILLLVGAYTQGAALAAFALSGWFVFSKTIPLPYPKIVYRIVLVLASTILLSGAGPFAFDLPL